MRFSQIVCLSAACVSIGAAPARAATPAPITGVVELFTSQGCSSCPPADKVLASMVEQAGILALSFNVDYWDNLGWKDTLADPAFSRRQRAYAQARGDGQVYTPQVIVDGLHHVIGSDKASIEENLTTMARAPQVLSTRLDVSRTDDGGARIALPTLDIARSSKTDATVWLVAFEPRVEVTIERGENSGRTVAYHNVVRRFVDVGHWTGTAETVTVAPTALTACKAGSCALLVQAGGTGKMLGASWLPGAGGM